MLRSKVCLAVVILLSVFLAANFAAAQEVNQLSMGSATAGGIFANVAGPMAQCINKAYPKVNITAEFTQGSTENLRLISQDKMQLAIITPAIGVYAREGKRMFKGQKMDFRVLARLMPNSNLWVVLADSGIKKFSDFKGRKIGVGPASGGLGVNARSQLTANGINYKKDIKPLFLGAGDMAEALKDGAIEAAYLTEELTQMVATTEDIQIVSWEDGAHKAFLKKNPNYGRYDIPAGKYKGVDYPVLSVDNGIQFICHAGMDEETAYNITKALMENVNCIAQIYAPAKAISAKLATSKLGNPYHPGAIRYYKEIGAWQD
jgi:TRAP transporter TAXI family solute receptor